MRSELDPVYEEYNARKGTKDEVVVSKIEYPTSPLTQLRYVTQRTLRNMVRNPQQTIMQIMVMVIFALIVGIIYFQVDDSKSFGIQNR